MNKDEKLKEAAEKLTSTALRRFINLMNETKVDKRCHELVARVIDINIEAANNLLTHESKTIIDFAKSQAAKEYHQQSQAVDLYLLEFNIKQTIETNTFATVYNTVFIEDACLSEIIELIKPHLSTPTGKSEWVSVEYAPKDGTKILGYCENSECYYIVYWNRSMGDGCWNCDGNPYLPKIIMFQLLPQSPIQNNH